MAGNLPTSVATPTEGAEATGLRHTGTFSYTGMEPNVEIQPDHKVSTGDAVFTKSVGSLDTRFEYRLDGAGRDDAAGKASMG